MTDKSDFDSQDSFDFWTWVSYLSYEKIHALAFGFVFAFLAAWLANGYILAVGIGVLLWAIGVRTSPHRHTATGDKEVAKKSRDGRGVGLQAQLLVEIRHKPHYYIVGLFTGDLAGSVVHFVMYGVFPTHYDQLPRLIETVAMFF